MKRLIEFPLNGSTVWVEVEDTGAAALQPHVGERGIVRAGRGDEVMDQARQSFDDALQKIKPALQALTAQFNDLNNPSEIEVEFGIKFTMEAGVVFASTATEANFRVQVTWKNDPAPEQK